MRTKLGIVVCAGIVGLGCGGSGGGSPASNRGLLFYSSVVGSTLLHRIGANGGTIADVPGTAGAFEGTMDQNGDVYTSLAGTGDDVFVIVNGTPIQLTNAAGDDFRPCATPAGDVITFISTRDGNDEVYVMNGDGSSQTNLSLDAGSDYYPAINRAGTKVVFTSNRDGNDEIYIVNVDGSGFFRLTNNAATDTTPAFSADGSKVIFSSNRGGTYQIYRMNLDGSNVVPVTNSANDKFHASYKVDGSAIFYYEVVGAERTLHRCDPNGGSQRLIDTGNNDSDKMCTWVF